jgi:hypothetical protein
MKKGRDRRSRRYWLASWLLAAAHVVCADEFGSDGWRKLPPEELAMKSEPLAPGAAAVYLYTQIDRDDNSNDERVYRQIKVLTEEGRDRANLEIEYTPHSETIRNIEARVIQADGSVVPFRGTVYDRAMVSKRDAEYHVKALALPDVRVGSIIEYRFTRRLRFDVLYDSSWILSQDLLTRSARYTLRPYQYETVRWATPHGLPEGTTPAQFSAGAVRLEAHNIPAIPLEEYMPPPREMKFRVEFIYTPEDLKQSDPVKFWKAFGKGVYRDMQHFVGSSGSISKVVSGLVATGDSDEQKARKLYAHVQQLRNTSYEEELDDQEAKRAKLSDASNAADVAKHGYGNSYELTLYFLALLRAANLTAEPVLVGERSQHFFSRKTMNPKQLDSTVIAVKLGDEDVLLDPAVPCQPFGLLNWVDTAVSALKLDRDGGEWISTPLPKAADARTLRRSELELTPDGSLEGTVVVTYDGHEALWRRLQQRHNDDVSRREFLEEEFKQHLASGATVKLTAQPDWDGVGTPLQVKYHVVVPNWAVVTGGRLLVGIGLFGAAEKGVFVKPDRQHPIYFPYPFKVEDELRIVLPAGYHMQGSPEPQASGESALKYETGVESVDGALLMHRMLTVDALLSTSDAYPQFRKFFETVRAGDEQQVVLAH